MTGVFVQLNKSSNRARNNPLGYLIQENGCWEWVGSRTRHGYGQILRDGRMVGAHKFMWERVNGEVPDGLQLDHFVCSNRGCVNPEHMRPVTCRENLLRGNGHSAKNAAKTHCPRGHQLARDNLRQCLLVRHGWRSCRTCYNDQRRAHWRHAT